MGSVDSPSVLESTLETLIRRARIPRTYQAAYFGGCSSPFNQPVAFSVFSGSGPSHSKHWIVCGPLPPGGSARIKKAPQPGQVGRSAWPMIEIYDRQALIVRPVPDTNTAKILGKVRGVHRTNESSPARWKLKEAAN
jgi:hypothetical protein